MSSSLLTAEEVADLLKISPRAVYKYRQRLGGFYPFGIRVLRFRREDMGVNEIYRLREESVTTRRPTRRACGKGSGEG